MSKGKGTSVLSLFKRMKTFMKSELPAKENSLNDLQKQVEKSIRELKVKIETIETHVQRTEQEIIEKNQLAGKYSRYVEKSTGEADKSNFKLQEQKAKKEIIELKKTKKQLVEGLVRLQQVYDKMDDTYTDTIQRIHSIEVELKNKQEEGNLQTNLKQLEEESMRQLFEAEALLELRKDPY